MRLKDAEDLARFVEELKRESDRGLPLVGAALIDDRLAETLRSFFVDLKVSRRLIDDANAPLGTLSARAQACLALALIDEREYSEIELVRKVRNEFAHAKHGITFDSEKVASFCANLQSDLPMGADYPINDPRFRFTNAIVCLVLRLYYRPEWVAQERRMPKVWMPHDATKWRLVADEPPPSGVPIIGLAKSSVRKE